MELRDFFSGNWWALILVPAVTALIAGVLFVSSADERFEATAVISITEYFESDSPAAVRAVIDEFDNALESRQVVDVVAERAPSAPTFRVKATAVGDGGDVRVSFEAPTRADAEAALDAGVREALTLVSESVGRAAGRGLVAADNVANDAFVDLQDIEAAAGAADLEAELARRSADLLALRNQIAAAAGNPIVQVSLEQTLDAKQEELRAIEAQLLPWTNARARFDLAVEAGAQSSLELRRIETNEADLQTEDVLQSLRTPEVSNVQNLLRVVVAAAVVTAGAVVLIALVLGSDRRRRDEESGDADDTADLDADTFGASDTGAIAADDWVDWVVGGSSGGDRDEASSAERHAGGGVQTLVRGDREARAADSDRLLEDEDHSDEDVFDDVEADDGFADDDSDEIDGADHDDGDVDDADVDDADVDDADADADDGQSRPATTRNRR